MNTLIIPSMLLISEMYDTKLYTYANKEELEIILSGMKSRYILVCYEDDFSKYKYAANEADYIIIITYKREFMQFSHNIYFIHGEKINAYTLFLMSKMVNINQNLKEEVLENYKIGISLSAEKDKSMLWDKILSFCRRATRAEAGTLYLMSKDKKAIFFVCSQNEKLDKNEIEQKEIPFNKSSLVGFVCSSGHTLNIEDAYEIPEELPYKFNKAFDVTLGYRTKSILTVPMLTPHGEIIGAVQLLNKKNFSGDYVSFSGYDEVLLRSLSSLSAVTVENNRLYDDISNLFDSLIISSTKAIEQRDPATKGHSVRVSKTTLAAMELIDNDIELFPDVKFNSNDYRAAEIASMLHDFGKVGVRENILTKINKLYPSDYERLKGRLFYIKVLLEREALVNGSSDYIGDMEFIRVLIERLDTINSPAPMSGENLALVKLARDKKVLIDGFEHRFLTDEEADYLMIEKGNLTTKERDDMESHVVFSYEILRAMKWPYELSKVPDYVISHHEKLDGSGYPMHLKDNQIGIIERVIAIADIYDALTASDRSYKKAIPREIALKIINEEVEKGKLDKKVFRLFKENIAYIEEQGRKVKG